MNNNKPTFFTSDWHIGHFKALEYDQRPFKNLKEMHETLITRYNATVPENGICYFLGDMGNKPLEIAPVIQRLNGTKVLIWGNHDKGVNTMYNCGFDVVIHSASIYIGNNRVTMSHCPLMGVFREDTSHMKSRNFTVTENWHGESRELHQRCSLKDEGQYHLHGHIHSRKDKLQSQKILQKQYDIGVVGNKYSPVSLPTIESWVLTYGR